MLLDLHRQRSHTGYCVDQQILDPLQWRISRYHSQNEPEFPSHWTSRSWRSRLMRAITPLPPWGHVRKILPLTSRLYLTAASTTEGKRAQGWCRHERESARIDYLLIGLDRIAKQPHTNRLLMPWRESMRPDCVYCKERTTDIIAPPKEGDLGIGGDHVARTRCQYTYLANHPTGLFVIHA